MTAGKFDILFVISSLAVGGAEGQLIKLISRLDREKFEPAVALLAEADPVRVSKLGCAVESIGVAGGGYSSFRSIFHSAMAVWRLHRIVKRQRPAVVHAFLPAPSIISAFALKLARSKAPLIVSRRSMVASYRRRNSFAGFVDKFCTRLFATVSIGNSRQVTRELVDIDKVNSARALTIYNGVDPAEFDGSARELFPRPSAEVVFCMVANFRRQKGHLDFVRIAKEISRHRTDCAFILLGHDQGTLKETVDAVVREGLTSRFTFVPSSVAPNFIYAVSDIYLCTSESEGFSNVILEAMSSGLPVIASDVGGNGEAVINGDTGFVVPVGDIKAFTDKALQLAENGDLRTKMGQSGRTRAAAKFGVEEMVRSYEGVYLKCAQGLASKVGELARSAHSV
jgi:glycosyltransferase involved in cell wall biosynthesis